MPEQPDFHEEALRVIPYLHVSGVRESLRVLKSELAEAYARGRREATEDAYGMEPADLGDGYHELELAHGRWYFLDDLGVRVMAGLRRPYTVLRWKRLREAAEGWEREWGTVGDGWAYPARSEKAARDVTRYSQGGATVFRLVGPWEPAPAVNAEQPEADDGDQKWRAWLLKSGRDQRVRPVCCDLHGRNCEQGGEECCERCTEIYHFKPGHGGVPCSAPDLSGNGEPARGGTVATEPDTRAEDDAR